MLPKTWAGLRVRSSAMAALVMALGLFNPAATDRALAHEGHDHEASGLALPVSSLPRAVATGDEFEAVAILTKDGVRLFIDRYADNAPVTGATVKVTIGAAEVTAIAQNDGSFRVVTPELVQPGRHDLVIAIQDGSVSDLLVATLETSNANAAVAGATDPATGVMATWLAFLPPAWRGPIWSIAGAVAIMALAAALVLRRKPTAEDQAKARAGKPINLLILAAVAASALALDHETAYAHGDEDHGATVAPPPVAHYDSPRRLPDGSVFLPKTSQRLLDVRTRLAKEAPQTPRQSFVGRVIANPNRSGLVQSSSGGRIVPPATGLPMLGQAVKAGDVLASVTPGSLAIGSANVVQIAGDVDQQIALARTRLERARKLFASNAGTRVAVEEADLQLQGLERRRADIDTSEVKSETLVAPVDGVISAARAVPGQVVAPNDILFEIIDTSSLWVEAFVFDAAGSAAFKDPIASTGDGRTFPLVFLGRSRSLRQQSAILQFQIVDRAVGLDVGSPMTVHALSGDAVIGVILPRSAVVRAANGEDIVWRHTQPERFVAQPVRASAFDGANVLVQAGLASGERIVVQAAELINQVR